MQPSLFRQLLWLLALTVPALALAEPFYQQDGLAIAGYDPVAYFTEAEAVPGSPEHELNWAGTTWRFVNAEHRRRFADDPERFAPLYGGYCAYAAGKGYIAEIDPRAWTVHQDRLYLNYSTDVRRQWLADQETLNDQADHNWPDLREQL